MPIWKRPALALVSVALAAPLFQAAASTITYTAFSAWNANVTSAIELNLTAIASSGSYSTPAGKTLVPSSGTAYPFIFTGPDNGAYQLNGGILPVNGRNIVGLFGPSDSLGNITITLPSGGENAFLVTLGSTTASPATLTFSDGQTFKTAVAPNAFNYFGVSVSHNISSITIAMPGQPIVDDFFFAKSQLAQDQQAAPTAECSTLALIGTGLLGLFSAGRKIRVNKLAL